MKTITNSDIREQVRLALCRLVRDSLEWNDFQERLGVAKDVREESEDSILEDAQLVMDYLNLRNLRSD